ncbi:MAG: GTPase Era [Coprobacillus sp.]|nr:GTPase Era [Coprobacillus sp.]
MKSGYVLIMGRPNVGKSTILNKIMGRKISIVTAKPQTTRNNIKGIYEDEDCEIVFIDSPGVHKPDVLLNEKMNDMVYRNMEDVDVIMLVIDASKEFGGGDQFMIDKLKDNELPLIVVFNKIDLIRMEKAIKLKDLYKKLLPNAIQIETVATEGFNIDEIIKTIKGYLPEGPRFYEEGTISDRDEIFQIKEIIREKILENTEEEVPHAVAIYLNNIDWEKKPIFIDASINVEKESQKPILIGKGGKMIKKIGIEARRDIEKLLKARVNLSLTVKVEKNWRENEKSITKFGYNE